MTTTTVKTIGAGRDYPDVMAFMNGYVKGRDLVVLDEMVVGEVYDSGAVSFGANDVCPLSGDATRYALVRPAPGLGVNDLNTSGAADYGTAGIELNFNDWCNFGHSVSFADLRMQVSGPQMSFGGPLAGASSAPNTFSRCRFLLTNATMLSAGNHAAFFQADDCLFIRNATTTEMLYVDWDAWVRRCTFVCRGTGAVTGLGAYRTTQWGRPTTIHDNLFINCSDRPIVFLSGLSTGTRSNNFTDTALNPANTAENAILTFAAGLATNTANDYRPAAGSAILGAATASAQGTLDLRHNNRGTTPDVGAVQRVPAIALPSITVGAPTVDGQTVTIAGSVTGSPTAGTITLSPATVPNGAVQQGPAAATLGTGTFTTTFTAVPAGNYTPQVSMTNLGGTATASGADITIIAVGGTPVQGEPPASTGGAPVPTIASTAISARLLSANGPVDMQGDVSGTVAAFLDPYPTGTPQAVAVNLSGDFWGLQAALTGNSYRLRVVATANGQSGTALSGIMTIETISGSALLPAA